MKPSILRCFVIFGILVCSTPGFSQTLDWSSSFSPAWTDGAGSRTASNVSPGVNVTVTVTNSQPGSYQNITSGVASPAINNNNSRSNFFIIAGSSDCMEIDVDWSNDAAYVDVVYNFSKPVYHVVFRVGDIDKASSTSSTYFDRVSISGLNGSATVLPSSITEVNDANFLTISGNVVHATTSNWQGGNASTNTTSTSSQQGTVEVNFGNQALTQLTLRYDNHPSAQNNPALQAIAIGNLSYSVVNISGTVWNDINNSANNSFSNIFSSGELGTNAGNALYVNLVDSDGDVVNSAAVAANGTYSMTAPRNTNNLTLRLGTTQGTPGTAAPANGVPASWTNTSPLQTTAFNTATADISGRDFGIEQLPETAISSQSSVGNPGGFNFFAISASAFQTSTGGHPNTSDASGGTVSQVRIISFPTNTNALRINSTTYVNGGTCAPSGSCSAWPAGGVLVAYTNGAGPSVPIAIDPVEGNVDAVISFAAVDNAAKEDPTPGSITIPFRTVPLSGRVWNDGNGNLVQDGGEQFINGTNSGGGMLPGSVLYANLVNPGGIVIASVAVQSNGTYQFPDIPRSTNNLVVQINSVQGVIGNSKPSLVPPPGWGIAGENKNGQGGPPDGTRNGEITVNAGAAIITLQNFGLDRLPVADPKNYFIQSPYVNTFISLNGTGLFPGPLSGNDPEDGPLGSSDIAVITGLPSNGNQLWYNGTQISLGSDVINPPSVSNPYVVNNFNPSLLQVRATALGTTTASFDYAFIDAAGLQGNAASYSIDWAIPLPVTLTSFTVKPENNNAVLQWTVENQVDFDRFEIEYAGSHNSAYETIGTAFANGQPAASYMFVHKDAASKGPAGYYRLKMIDLNGSNEYSYVAAVRFGQGMLIDVRPTLLRKGETVRVSLSGNDGAASIRLLDMTGRILDKKLESNNSIINVETTHLHTGTYFLEVTTGGHRQTFKLLIQ